jgi:hypothetical protein
MEREQEVADFADRYGTGAASNSNTATNSNSKSHVALAESFEQLGLSPTDAAVAARGR